MKRVGALTPGWLEPRTASSQTIESYTQPSPPPAPLNHPGTPRADFTRAPTTDVRIALTPRGLFRRSGEFFVRQVPTIEEKGTRQTVHMGGKTAAPTQPGHVSSNI